jgi:hypothetical protein
MRATPMNSVNAEHISESLDFRSHHSGVILEALLKGEGVWFLDADDTDINDTLIGTQEEVERDVLDHHELAEIPEGWSLSPVELEMPEFVNSCEGGDWWGVEEILEDELDLEFEVYDESFSYDYGSITNAVHEQYAIQLTSQAVFRVVYRGFGEEDVEDLVEDSLKGRPRASRWVEMGTGRFDSREKVDVWAIPHRVTTRTFDDGSHGVEVVYSVTDEYEEEP